jgi:hypothetical protein
MTGRQRAMSREKLKKAESSRARHLIPPDDELLATRRFSILRGDQQRLFARILSQFGSLRHYFMKAVAIQAREP